MSEPIELYDVEGNLVVLNAPRYAKLLVASGELFETPPTVVEPEVEEQEEEREEKPQAKRAATKKEA